MGMNGHVVVLSGVQVDGTGWPTDSTTLRFLAPRNPPSHPSPAFCTGRMFNDTSHPRFRIVAALAPCAKKPIEGLSGWSRMMSEDFLLYHVTLASARSLKKPKSNPASNSFERSGLRV